MPLPHWSRPFFTAVLMLAACKPAPAAAQPAAAATPGTKTPPTPAPASVLSLSYLKSVAADRCEWLRQPLPSGTPTSLFTFDAACGVSTLAWSPDRTQGLVFSAPDVEGARPRLWRVDHGARTGKALEQFGLPANLTTQAPKPFIEQAGFDAQGQPLVLVSDLAAGRKVQKGKKGERFLVYEGQRYPVTEPSEATGVASAYRWEGSAWKRIETKVSTYEPSTAPGVNILEAARSLAPSQPSREALPGKEAPAEAVTKLDAALPGQEKSGKWMALSTPGGTLYYRAALDYADDSLYPVAPVRFEQGGKLVELQGVTAKDGDRLDFQLQDGLLLLSVQGSDAHAAYVLDTRTKKSLVSLKDAESETFWPSPTK